MIYGYREEAISTYYSIRRNGIMCTTAICMGTRCDPSAQPRRIPIESALAAEKGWPTPRRYEPPCCRLACRQSGYPVRFSIDRFQLLALCVRIFGTRPTA
jgi:hypothetical protein